MRTNQRPDQIPVMLIHSVAEARRRSVRFVRLALLLLIVVGGSCFFHRDGAAILAAESRQPVNAESCTVQPKRHRRLVDLARAPEGIARELASGAPVATPEPPGPGTPADSEVVASVNATARQLVACYNAGDLRRLFALYSEDYLYAVWGGFAGPDPTIEQIEAAIAFISTPVPQPEADRISLVSVQDVQQLPSGRVMAVLNLSTGSLLTVFVYTDGWYQVEWAYPLP